MLVLVFGGGTVGFFLDGARGHNGTPYRQKSRLGKVSAGGNRLAESFVEGNGRSGSVTGAK